MLAVTLIGLSAAATAQKASPKAAPTVSVENEQVQNIPDGYRLLGKYQDLRTQTYYLVLWPKDDGTGDINYNKFMIFYGSAGKAFSEAKNNGGKGGLGELVFNTTLGMVTIVRHAISGSTVTINGKDVPIEKLQ